MQAIKGIVWFLLLLLSLYCVFELIGLRGLVRMFPEGWRWWMLPTQLIALIFFAAVVYFNPWSYHVI